MDIDIKTDEDGSIISVKPLKLYKLSTSVVADNFNDGTREDILLLPGHVLFDVYYTLYKKKMKSILSKELSNLEVMTRVVKEINRRRELLEIFQTAMDFNKETANNLACAFTIANREKLDENMISLGLIIGSFLEEAGWFYAAVEIFKSCRSMCSDNNQITFLSLQCHRKVLHVQSIFYLIEDAQESYDMCVALVSELESQGIIFNYASLYTDYSAFFYCKSDYDQAYHWSTMALDNLTDDCSPCVIIDTLCQASKPHVIKRQLVKAELLILQALYKSRELCNYLTHSKFINALLDYAFYLLNSDCVKRSVTVYELALKMRKMIFGKKNLLVAIAEDELAYALYVNEYSSGRFTESKYHAENAIEVFHSFLKQNHLLLASAHRVKALILEEIALDSNEIVSMDYYLEAERLHINALHLSKTHFGENNVQTAKHYGNIGRLYQSMHRFDKAEEMQLKAIAIKEKVLGLDDYEVGLSVGHLASLYNYHMHEYQKAEKLYFRSIDINLKLFSRSYSGLEYDYRGLIHVYECLEDFIKMSEYTQRLNEWKTLRENQDLHDMNTHNLDFDHPSDSMKSTLLKYYDLC